MTWRDHKSPAPAPASRQRAPRFSWCKVPNEFPDYPVLRAAALLARVPVHQVVAVALRLECLANGSDPRGSVADMNVTEFAASLQLRPDAVARIRAALEHPDIFWIDQDFITGFQARNPESEDHTAAARQRRRRAKLKAERESTTGPPAIHSHVTSRRDTVTVTPREDQTKNPLCREDARASVTGQSVDNSGDKASGTAAGSGETRAETPAIDPQQQAELWLATDGTRIVTEQLLENRQLASTKIARWRDQELGGDAAALVEVIKAADRAGVFGLRFLNLVVDGIAQVKRRATAQAELPMPPVLASERKMA